LDVLDIEGRLDIDAGGEQLLDIEVALGVSASWGIGMGQLVDDRDLGMPCEDRVEIHLLEDAAPIFDLSARDDFEPGEQRLRFLAAMRLDDADDDIGALAPLCLG